MKKIKIVFLVFCLIFSTVLTSCASKNKAEELYSKLKPYAIKNEIVMVDNHNHIFLNGNEFYLKADADYQICYVDNSKIYFVEHRKDKYWLKSVDYYGENEEIIEERKSFIELGSTNEQDTVEISIDEVYKVENVGEILKNYELKPYGYVHYGDTLYFTAKIRFGLHKLFLCFKYEDGKLIFVDSCIYIDGVEVCKITHN